VSKDELARVLTVLLYVLADIQISGVIHFCILDS
jgi:hypothetical protein